MFRLSGVFAGYHGTAVIKDINLSLEPGTITSILGRNGCGKSTLLKAATGIIRPYQGEVYLGEAPLSSIRGKKLAQMISYLPQKKDIPGMRVQELIIQGRYPYYNLLGNPQPKDIAAAEDSLERMGLTELRDNNLRELSGGQQQKAYLAMILAQDTEIICFDEPTTFLDINYQLEILDVIKEMRNQGKTILMVLHDINHALRYSDRLCIMEDGNIKAYDTPEVIIANKIIDRSFHIIGQELSGEDGSKHYVFSKKKYD